MARIFLYLYFCAAIFNLPIAIYSWAPPTSTQWVFLALISLSSFLGQSLITLSLRYGPPKALAPLCYTSVVFTLIFDWLFWHHMPTWTAWMGILLVITGGIVALLLEVKLKKIG
jgi:drug/metabolite transporter (DMT)-like permease